GRSVLPSFEERLKRVLDPMTPRPDLKMMEQQQAKLQARVSEGASKLGKTLRPNNEAALGRVRLKLLNAGFRGEQAVLAYYGWKVVGMLSGLAISGPLVLSRYGMTQSGIMYCVMAAAVGFYLPDWYVGRRKKKRWEAIFLALP